MGLIRVLHSMSLATVCVKPDCSYFDFFRESCSYTGILELYVVLEEQTLEGERKKAEGQSIVFDGWCKLGVEA